MPAAVAVPLITGAMAAGTTIYAANKAGNAAKQAANTQTNAGNQALDLERQMYDQQRADAEPYRQIGYGALNALAGRMGGSFGMQSGPAPMMKQGQPVGGGLSLSGLGQPQGQSQGQMGGKVMMQAPNGQRQLVPAEQVQHYTQMGAQVVQ